MATTLNRLNSRFVQTVTEAKLHADGGGLYLRVDTTGAKRWVFIFQWRKARKEMGLGSFNSISLGKARDLAEKAREQVAAGLNPIEERKKAPAADAPTFGELSDELFEQLKPTWTGKKTADRWKRNMTVHVAALRPKRVDAISTEDVLEALKPIWTKIPDMAPRARAGIEDVLNAARAKGFRSGDNPARWVGHLEHLLSPAQKLTRGHHAAMPFEDVPTFVRELRTHTGMARRLAEFTVLTAVRPSEAREAAWHEVDLTAKVWTIPPERMKERIEHRVPLSDQAIAVLEQIKADGYVSELVFPGAREGSPLSNVAAAKLFKAIPRPYAYTLHGFRSSFRDWAGERTNFPREIAEAALAHAVGNQVERAYRRGDALEKRRKLMDAWARYIETVRQPGVLPFRGQAS